MLGLFSILSEAFLCSIFKWFFSSLTLVHKEGNHISVRYVQLRD